MNKQVIRIEMDDNMLEAVKAVVDAVSRGNDRAFITRSPGKEIQRAFSIDVTKIIKEDRRE